MKIRHITIAAVVTAGFATAQVFASGGTAQALESRPGMGVLKSQDAGRTWQIEPSTEGNTYYVGTANGGVWKTTDGGSPAPAQPVPTGQVVFHIDH